MFTDFEFLLEDRISKIQAINKQYDLENNAYISFSGGKDSTVLHYLIDLALPNNKIPRVFVNTGIEYNDIVNFVKEMQQKDDRIIIINSGVNIKQMLEKYGYPFKSKEHSKLLSLYQNGSRNSQWLSNYLSDDKMATKRQCPKILKYQFANDFKINISANCCEKMKKQPIAKWEKENNKTIAITGMRKEEGGQRANIQGCILTDKQERLKRFHPLLVVDEQWITQFQNKYKIKFCKLYYSPYNFKRTGCKGCPFSLKLDEQLKIMREYLPSEYKQCENIWKPVYDEYRRIGYRLKKNQDYEQMTIYDFIGEK